MLPLNVVLRPFRSFVGRGLSVTPARTMITTSVVSANWLSPTCER